MWQNCTAKIHFKIRRAQKLLIEVADAKKNKLQKSFGVAKAAQTFSLRPPEAQSCTMYASESRLEVASVTK